MTTPLLFLQVPPEIVGEERPKQIRRLAHDFEVRVSDDTGDIAPDLDRLEVFCGFPSHSLFKGAPRLKWFQNIAAGMDWLKEIGYPLPEDCRFSGAAGIHPIQITEHVFGHMLMLTRRYHLSMRMQVRREWPDQPTEVLDELYGKTLLIVGLGNIGLRVARIAHAFGMRVTGLRRNPPAELPVGIEKVVPPEDLLRALSEADYVLNALPHTSRTDRFFSAQAFAAMKPGAYFLNVGRGKTVDEGALIEALRSGRLGGAGLDVFEAEPLPKESPLWDLENVIISGHYAGKSVHNLSRLVDFFRENLERFLRGETLRNEITQAEA